MKSKILLTILITFASAQDQTVCQISCESKAGTCFHKWGQEDCTCLQDKRNCYNKCGLKISKNDEDVKESSRCVIDQVETPCTTHCNLTVTTCFEDLEKENCTCLHKKRNCYNKCGLSITEVDKIDMKESKCLTVTEQSTCKIDCLGAWTSCLLNMEKESCLCLKEKSNCYDKCGLEISTVDEKDLEKACVTNQVHTSCWTSCDSAATTCFEDPERVKYSCLYNNRKCYDYCGLASSKQETDWDQSFCKFNCKSAADTCLLGEEDCLCLEENRNCHNECGLKFPKDDEKHFKEACGASSLTNAGILITILVAMAIIFSK